MEKLSSRELKIFLTVFLITGLFAQWYGVNANSRFDLTRSMVDHGSLNINEVYRNAGDRSYYEGDYYSDKEPGMAFLALPAYTGWKTAYSFFGDASVQQEPRSDLLQSNNVTISYPTDPGNFYLSSLIVTILLTSTLSLSILTILIYRLSEEFLEDERKRLVVTFGFAFGTLLTHYGAMFMPNAVVTLFSFSSFYLLYKWEDYPGFRKMALSGILGGFAVVVDPTAGPVLVASFFYAFLKFDRFPLSYVLGGFIGGLPMMVYNTVLFGYPWMLPRFFLDPALYPNLQQASHTLPQLTEQGFRLHPKRLFFVAMRLLAYPHRGIFYWFPFLILALLGARKLKKEKPEFSLALLISSAGIIFIVAGWWAWWMGGFFGARYLAVIIPFLMVPIFYASDKIDIKIITVLVAISIVVNLAGFHGHYEDSLKDLSNSSEMKSEYQDKVKSFEPLANPVREYYLEGLFEEGPQSRILNGLYNRDIPPDIRGYTNYEKSAPLPIMFWTITVIVAGVWRKEIVEKMRSHRESVLESLEN